jgi:sterol desaturase/sphingolipid hydroxylase (fatty acid hydroxylase superfamily)
MSEQQFQLLKAGGFVFAVGLASLLQRLTPHGHIKGSARTNAALWLVDVAVLGTVCGACACTVARWAEVNAVGLFNRIAVPGWVAAAVTVVMLDLVSYLWHRANHAIPVLWRFHRVHHSDGTFTVSTAARFHPGELLLSLPVRLSAILLLGAPVGGIVLFELIFSVANFVEHGDIDVPARVERRLGGLFITPALHRWHHSRRWADLNTNFGTIFVIWDRVLATYDRSSSTVVVATGLPGITEPLSLISALALPFTSVVGAQGR